MLEFIATIWAQALPTLPANIAVLFAAYFCYTQLLACHFCRYTWRWQLLAGICFGLLGLLSLYAPVPIRPGVIIDAKYVLSLSATLYGGPWTGLIAILLTGLGRLWMGGIGVYAAIPTLVVTWITGLLLHRFVKKPTGLWARSQFYMLLGLLLWVYQFIGGFSFLFLLSWDETLPIVFERSLPAILLYPPIFMLLAFLLDKVEYRQNIYDALIREQRIYRDLFLKSPHPLFVVRRQDHGLWLANEAFTQTFGAHTLSLELRLLISELDKQLQRQPLAILRNQSWSPAGQPPAHLSLTAILWELEGTACLLLHAESSPRAVGEKEGWDSQLDEIVRRLGTLRLGSREMREQATDIRAHLEEGDTENALSTLEKMEQGIARQQRLLDEAPRSKT